MKKGLTCNARIEKVTKNALFLDCNDEPGIVPRYDMETYDLDITKYSKNGHCEVVATSRFKSGRQVFFLRQMENARLAHIERKRALEEESAKPEKKYILECSYDEDYLRRYNPKSLQTEVFTCYVQTFFIEKETETLCLALTTKKPEKVSEVLEKLEFRYNGKIQDITTPFKLCMEGILWNGNNWVVITCGQIKLNGKSVVGVIKGTDFSKKELYQMDEIFIDYEMMEYSKSLTDRVVFCHTLESLHKSKTRAFSTGCTSSRNGASYESVEAQRRIGDVTLSKVVRINILFGGPKEDRQKYWICEYPAGTWTECRKRILESGLVSKGMRWNSIKMERIFDQDYQSTDGYEYRIAKIGS